MAFEIVINIVWYFSRHRRWCSSHPKGLLACVARLEFLLPDHQWLRHKKLKKGSGKMNGQNEANNCSRLPLASSNVPLILSPNDGFPEFPCVSWRPGAPPRPDRPVLSPTPPWLTWSCAPRAPISPVTNGTCQTITSTFQFEILRRNETIIPSTCWPSPELWWPPNRSHCPTSLWETVYTRIKSYQSRMHNHLHQRGQKTGRQHRRILPKEQKPHELNDTKTAREKDGLFFLPWSPVWFRCPPGNECTSLVEDSSGITAILSQSWPTTLSTLAKTTCFTEATT